MRLSNLWRSQEIRTARSALLRTPYGAHTDENARLEVCWYERSEATPAVLASESSLSHPRPVITKSPFLRSLDDSTILRRYRISLSPSLPGDEELLYFGKMSKSQLDIASPMRPHERQSNVVLSARSLRNLYPCFHSVLEGRWTVRLRVRARLDPSDHHTLSHALPDSEPSSFTPSSPALMSTSCYLHQLPMVSVCGCGLSTRYFGTRLRTYKKYVRPRFQTPRSQPTRTVSLSGSFG